MRLPNGFGSITKLSGKRRNPYMVRVTVGRGDDGKINRKTLGYYKTRAEAIAGLSEYRQNPYDVDSRSITFAELYERWGKSTYNNDTIPNTYQAAYKRCPTLHEMPFTDIRKRHMQGEIDNCDKGYSTKKNIRTLLNKLAKYAIDHEIMSVNYAALTELPPKTDSRIHTPFTPQDLDVLWQHCNSDLGAKIALILSYTGLRPTELLKITTDNVNLEERYMRGGMKTSAGKNRLIPIADKIYALITSLYNPDNKYLILSPVDNSPILTYDRLRYQIWQPSKALAALPHRHLPHDGRHTCATMLDDANVNKKIIQLILGHRSQDITYRVYTHKTIEQLKDAINQI